MYKRQGLTFPIYIGAMIAAALMRNIAEYAGNGKLVIHMGEINDLGGISLSLLDVYKRQVQVLNRTDTEQPYY